MRMYIRVKYIFNFFNGNLRYRVTIVVLSVVVKKIIRFS